MKYITLLFALFTMFSAYAYSVPGGEDEFSEEYSFTRTGASEPLILLQLNADQTFLFIDKSNPRKHIKARGKYRIRGRMIRLNEIRSNRKIARKWQKDRKCDCIRSRKRLEFTRICNE